MQYRDPFLFENRQAALDFVEKNAVYHPDFFGTVSKEKMIEAINALDLSPIPESEKEEDCIAHGNRWIVKITVDVHSYGNAEVYSEGWMIDRVQKVDVSRALVVDYVAKREKSELKVA